jgi:hypothetical protein
LGDILGPKLKQQADDKDDTEKVETEKAED